MREGGRRAGATPNQGSAGDASTDEPRLGERRGTPPQPAFVHCRRHEDIVMRGERGKERKRREMRERETGDERKREDRKRERGIRRT